MTKYLGVLGNRDFITWNALGVVHAGAQIYACAMILPKGATGDYIDIDGVGLSSRCVASPLVSCKLLGDEE